MLYDIIMTEPHSMKRYLNFCCLIAKTARGIFKLLPEKSGGFLYKFPT